ncbi:MAG: thiamine diphosphokinase [Ilumatobacteraceae bacterium]|nr:thiamine diphosphokinase [Ilumatobacteraceae bacterium]
MSQVVVIVGGGSLSPRAVEAVEDDAVIVAADSGLDHAVEAGLRPAHLVGDLDSISASGRMWAYAHELTIDEHPAAKDLTDTELALATAVELAGDEAPSTDLLLLGAAAGDRLDHLLGTLLALGHPALAALATVRAVLGTTEVHTVHAGHTARPTLEPGQVFSVLALHGPCTGVRVRGAEWELVDADLSAHEARGVSNLAKEDVMVTVGTGVLSVVIP